MRTVASADGTLIAYEQGGKGPHLLLVHGMAASRARWASIRPRLEEHFTVIAMDRRGRGESGDSPDYSIERESDDIAAVVDVLHAPVLLFGHSYGALCALEAAMRSDKVAGLVLYEPAISEDGESGISPEQLERLEILLAAGNREGVVKAFMGEILELPPQQLEAMKTSVAWPSRVAAAHTLPREIRAEQCYRLAVDRVGNLSIPVLLLLGGDSPPSYGQVVAVLEKALPKSRTVVLPGQQHLAMDTGPDLLVSAVLAFVREAS